MNRRSIVILAAAALTFAGAAAAQSGRPSPKPARLANGAENVQVVNAQPANGRPLPRPAREPAAPVPIELDDLGDGDNVSVIIPRTARRGGNGDKVVLGFDDVSVEDTLPFIVETTGKVVMPVNITTLKAKKVTLINDEPIDRMDALDLLIQAFRLNDIGVAEYPDRIIIALLSEMPNYPLPVYGPDVDISAWVDRGTMITKIFAVENTAADNIAEQISDPLPDHASVMVDGNSNQIIVTGDVGLCQRIGILIQELDRNYIEVRTQTFRLAYADANEIAQNILDLFEETGTAAAGQQRTGRTARMTAAQRRRARQTPGATGTTDAEAPGPTAELRITVNVQQNAVTVSGDPSIVDEIARLIGEVWDLPRPKATKKVYHLMYTDPIKMRDMLTELLGGSGGGIGGAARRARGGAAGAAGGAGRSDVSEVIGGIYQIQAYPDSNSLVVISKTSEAFEFLDSLIVELDQPVYPGIPIVVALKHADAEEIADQINAIFAPAGARVDIQRRETGLRGIDVGGGGVTGADTGGGDAREAGEGGAITFPWQQSRGDEEQTPESPLIGKVRVVPIHRQNAVMILAAPEYRDAVRDIIVNQLDKPGRQVLIAAIIAEVELNDDLALGLRVSNSEAIQFGAPVDNRISASGSFSGVISNIFGGLFDSPGGQLTVGPNGVAAVLQLLSQKTKVRILQEPAVFTADNQEASFFEGQDVPVLVNSQLTPQGTLNETTEYQAVGIGLNVRPRITTHGDVDLEINLEISNIDLAATAVQGTQSPVFDRRETTTQIIVKDGQTIVISGILRDQESKIKRKVPLLGDIPLVGAVFTSIEDQTTRTELLAFITPFVVDNPDENDNNFNEEARQRLLDLSKPLDEQDATGVNRDDIHSRLLLERYKKYRQEIQSPQ